MLETPSQQNRPASQSTERPLRGTRLAAVLLLGIACQALVIFWIAASEIPARVFISSWSVSMPGILLLAAARGTTITIVGDGPDEQEALTALCQLIETGFGEEPWNA